MNSNNTYSKGFVVLAVFYAFLLVTSNILVGKIFTVYGDFVLTCGILVFPAVYVVSDILTEVYGYRKSLFSIRLNFICCFLFVVLTQIMLILPHPPFWEHQSAYEAVFNSTPRIFAASLASYYLGDWANSVMVSWMKKIQNGKNFAIRSIASSLVGQAVDSLLFFSIAFAGVLPLDVLITMITCQYVAKIGYEVVLLPITCRVVAWWKRLEGFDHIDRDETYNPFMIFKS